jgi:hypothetical protein
MLQFKQNPTDIPRANKQGVTFTACKIKRNKLKCFVQIAPNTGLSPRHKGDFLAFMKMAYRLTASDREGMGVEYQQIADALGWSRDAVTGYANRAKDRGLVVITKQLKRDLV